MLVFVPMIVRVGTIMAMPVILFMRMLVLMAVVVLVVFMVLVRGTGFGGQHIDFGGGDSSAAHLAGFEACAHVQGRGGFGQALQWNAGIDQRAQQHVAADAGKALQISNSHRS